MPGDSNELNSYFSGPLRVWYAPFVVFDVSA